MLCRLLSNGFRETMQGKLCCTINSMIRKGFYTSYTGNVNENTVFSLNEARENSLYAVEHTEDIDLFRVSKIKQEGLRLSSCATLQHPVLRDLQVTLCRHCSQGRKQDHILPLPPQQLQHAGPSD